MRKIEPAGKLRESTAAASLIPIDYEFSLKHPFRCPQAPERGARTLREGHVLCRTSSSRMELGLCLSRGLQWANDLDC